MITVGIDEVGRGCWAGPLVAGAVILKEDITGLRDSKKLSKRQREVLSVQISNTSIVGLGWVWPEEIDALGLTAAVGLAMGKALALIDEKYEKIIIDGNLNYFAHDVRSEAIIRADDTVPSVSAASIVAKVARDNYMTQLGVEYPQYGFENHVGYGTLEHRLALKTFGVTKIHRMSYKPIKELL